MKRGIPNGRIKLFFRRVCEHWFDDRREKIDRGERIRWRGLRDSSFYVCQARFKHAYYLFTGEQITRLPYPDDDKAYKAYHDDILKGWCYKRMDDYGFDLWGQMRDYIKIEARQFMETMGYSGNLVVNPRLELDDGTLPYEKIKDEGAVLLFVEKGDSGRFIAEELVRRGYKVNVFLSQGLERCNGQLLLWELNERIENGESLPVFSIHDGDIGGFKIYLFLKSLCPSILDIGINDEFLDYTGFNFDMIAEHYESEENAITYLKNEGFWDRWIEKYIDKRIELPAFIEAHGVIPIVDFIEHKLKGQMFDLDRIMIDRCDYPKEEPERLEDLYINLWDFGNEQFPPDKIEHFYEDYIDKISDEYWRLSNELNDRYWRIRNAVDKLKDNKLEKRYAIIQDNVIDPFEIDNHELLGTDWNEDASTVFEAFRHEHEHYTGELIGAENYPITQKEFLDKIVDSSIKNKKILKQLEENLKIYIDEYE